MTPELENAVLSTDLDCNFFSLLNVAALFPMPAGLVGSDDPRLSDPRTPIIGSVTDDSVDPDAAIDQSKLNLNGDIPSTWLGTSHGMAAEGDLAEYVSHKGHATGYASLDGSGLIPTGQIPASVGLGTVTSIGLNMPAVFAVTGSPVTGAGTISVDWNTIPDKSWFGNNEGSTHTPKFYTTALPTTLIPSLDASIITTGTLAVARLPLMVGIGASHASGLVPDPGPSGGGSLATDYLARDGTYKAAPTLGATYQPTISDPVISHSTNVTGAQNITVAAGSGGETGITFFYSVTSNSTGFLEFPIGVGVSLPGGGVGNEIWVYAAGAGYINSNVVNYTNPNP